MSKGMIFFAYLVLWLFCTGVTNNVLYGTLLAFGATILVIMLAAAIGGLK